MDHQSLIQLDQANRMLAAIHTVDDARKIIDLAEAARVYARQVDLGLEAQNHAAEVKLRAQRRGGEILQQMEKNKGGGDHRLQAATGDLPPTLEDLGIEKTAAMRWQNIARLPAQQFEEFIIETKESGGEITTGAALKLAARTTPRKTNIHAASAPKITASTSIKNCQSKDPEVIEMYLSAEVERALWVVVDQMWPAGRSCQKLISTVVDWTLAMEAREKNERQKQDEWQNKYCTHRPCDHSFCESKSHVENFDL